MKSRPPKRQKRNLVQSSDTEYSDHEALQSGTTLQESPTKRRKPVPHDDQEQSSRKATRSNGGGKPAPQKDGRLRQAELSFSNHSTKGENPVPKTQNVVKRDLKTAIELEDDLIQDDDSENLSVATTHESCSVTDATSFYRSRLDGARHNDYMHKSKLPVRRAHILGGSNDDPSPKQSSRASDIPWVQRFPPRGRDELGVHKKKAAEVQSWLERALRGDCRQRLLLLRGPPGSGKTATIEVLGEVLSFSISDWRNVLDTTSPAGEYTSMLASFEEFLGRGEHYGSLQFDTKPSTSQGTGVANAQSSSGRKVLLVEEFPSSLFGSNSSLNQFREVLLRYLSIQAGPSIRSAVSAHSSAPAPHPLIVVISESAALSSGEVVDAFTAHRILGPDILSHPGVATVDFNPVAPTLLLKILEGTLKRAAPSFRERKTISAPLLRHLSESGDIRSAIASLEFLFLAQSRTPTSSSSSGTIAVGALAQRETVLELFHAVGKVVYNKRHKLDSAPSGSTRRSPTLVPDFDVQQVIDETGRDASTFVAALHQNMAASCAGPDFVDSLEACVSALSDADVLAPDGLAARAAGVPGGGWTYSANLDALRQTAISTSVAVRGVLAGLPYPVNRKAAAGSGAAARDSFKMFYPESMRLRNRAADFAATAERVLRTYRRNVADGAVVQGPEFVIELVPYLAMIATAAGGPVGKELRDLARYETLSSTPGVDGRAATNHYGFAAKARGEAQTELSTAVEEKLYLSDDDIEE